MVDISSRWTLSLIPLKARQQSLKGKAALRTNQRPAGRCLGQREVEPRVAEEERRGGRRAPELEKPEQHQLGAGGGLVYRVFGRHTARVRTATEAFT